MNLSSKKKAMVIVIVVISAPLLYTLVSFETEPNPSNDNSLSPSVTNMNYVNNLSKSGNFSNTLITDNFNVSGSSAAFSFAFINTIHYSPALPGILMQVYEMRPSLSMHRPYNIMFLNVDSAKLIFGHWKAIDCSFDYTVYWAPLISPRITNGSVVSIAFFFKTSSPVALENNTLTYNGGRNYNATYSLEVTPVVEYGPYYSIGKTVWVSKTFMGPIHSASI